MPHVFLELALWILLAFFVGCVAGCLLRKAFGPPAPETAAAPQPVSGAGAAAKKALPKPPRKPPGRSK